MRITGRRSASARPSSITAGTVAPEASARVPAAWITGPSASGSENGTPSSTRSAPASAYASPIAADASRLGNPPIRYGISAARPFAAANAALMLSVPDAKPGEHLREVLVPAAGEADQVERGRRRVRGQHPRHRVRGLERRDDALEL